MGKIKIKKNDVWIDMTPMSDVMVLLLTFFMLSVNFTKNEVVKVITPGSTTMAKVSSSAILDITIDPEGRVLMSTDKTVTMQKALDQMLKDRETNLTPDQKQEIINFNQIGIPVKSMPEFLGKSHEDQIKLMKVTGIPTDSLQSTPETVCEVEPESNEPDKVDHNVNWIRECVTDPISTVCCVDCVTTDKLLKHHL